MGSREEYSSATAAGRGRSGHHPAMVRRGFLGCLCLAAVGAGRAGPAAQAADGTTPTLESMVEAARADAQRRLAPGSPALQVVGTERVTWNDGSLGCPQPGRMYTQALVPGWRITLRSGTETFDYHASTRGGLVLCPANLSVEPRPGSRQ